MIADETRARTLADAVWIWLQRWQKPLWLALVMVMFCAPLFVGLGGTDLDNDEAIYSYAVDSILETGDWLNPSSSPNPDIVFVEKPPLKFWLVALPMRVGLLPHTEFGFRFWDALFASAAFLYVFALARRMAGPLCGLIALFVLYAFPPLLFIHGLRANVMEAPLVLAYCGGVFHFLRWSASIDPGPRRWHALAVGLFFVLGFMTKFVAVLFLPMILITTSLLVPAMRAKLRRDWRLWGGVAALAAALIVPWFAYEAVHVGHFLWDVIFTTHVVQRMTGTLEPGHLQPWSFYLSELDAWTLGSGTVWLAAAGGLLIVVRSVRDRWPEGIAVLIWAVLPLTAISFGTSKLLHYVYPFLPPFALAAGYAISSLLEMSRVPTDRLTTMLHERSLGLKMPRSLRTVFLMMGATATALAVVALVYGPIEIWVGAVRIFRNASIFRPTAFALVFGFLGGLGLTVARPAVIVMLMTLVPIPQYRSTLARTVVEQHTLRSARDCVLEVRDQERRAGRATPALLAALPPDRFVHPFYFYMRGAGFEWANPVSDNTLADALHLAGGQRPVLLPLDRYVEFVRGRSRVPIQPWPPALSTWAGPMPAVAAWISRSQAIGVVGLEVASVQLLLPGPYAGCGTPRVGPLLPTAWSPGPWRSADIFVGDSDSGSRHR